MTIHRNMTHDAAKKAASLQSLEFVKEGMIIGLGTGSTAHYFIHNLIEKCQKGFKIQAVATSKISENLAREGGIPMLDINTLTALDLVVDGADEIDAQKCMIKGAGGALVREKIIAKMSREMIVIIDETKLVSKLGKHPLPIEVISFGAEATKKHLENKGYRGTWRKNPDGSFFVTDNHNWILDITFSSLRNTPEKDHLAIIDLPGVVDTGFFFNLAGRIVIGHDDGSVVVQT